MGVEEGMRRSVVLSYNKEGELSKICYLQQKKKYNEEDFDVSAVEEQDIALMPKNKPPMNLLEQIDISWKERISCSSNSRIEEEFLDVKSGKYKSSTTNMHFSILARLLEIVNNTATITST